MARIVNKRNENNVACVVGGHVRRQKIRFLASCWTSSEYVTGERRKHGAKNRIFHLLTRLPATQGKNMVHFI